MEIWSVISQRSSRGGLSTASICGTRSAIKNLCSSQNEPKWNIPIQFFAKHGRNRCLPIPNDNQLGCDGVFKGNIFNFILSIVNNTRTNYILHRAIDVIFSRSLFADCSWTGCYRSGAKIGLRYYIHIVRFLNAWTNLIIFWYKNVFNQKQKMQNGE